MRQTLRAPSSNPLSPARLRRRRVEDGTYELLLGLDVVAVAVRHSFAEWRWGLAEGVEFTKPYPPARTGTEQTLTEVVDTVGWRIVTCGIAKEKP